MAGVNACPAHHFRTGEDARAYTVQSVLSSIAHGPSVAVPRKSMVPTKGRHVHDSQAMYSLMYSSRV